MRWWRAASPAKQLRRVILQLTIVMQVVITGRTNEAERLHTSSMLVRPSFVPMRSWY